MNEIFIKRIFFVVITVLIIAGCHLEQGKLYFDELGLDPITVYKMEPLETTIYCLVEANIPEGKALANLHKRAMAEVEENPESGNWGNLVCLALSENATVEQMHETINALQLVIAVRHRQANSARGFKALLEQKLDLYQRIEQGRNLLEIEKDRYEEMILSHKAELEKEKAATANQERKVKELEEKVQKLQEIELLLHPKN